MTLCNRPWHKITIITVLLITKGYTTVLDYVYCEIDEQRQDVFIRRDKLTL